MAVEDVGGEEEEEGFTTLEVEIVRTLVGTLAGTVVEAGTLVEEVVGMVGMMTEMDQERHENSTRKTLQ